MCKGENKQTIKWFVSKESPTIINKYKKYRDQTKRRCFGQRELLLKLLLSFNHLSN